MASGWNLWVWLVSVVVRRYIFYRYPHNNWRAARAPHLSYIQRRKIFVIYIYIYIYIYICFIYIYIRPYVVHVPLTRALRANVGPAG